MPAHPDYRKKWIQAGYSRYCASAEACLPPPRKYRRAYYLTTANHAISDIGLNRIKVARFADLNDPFELLAPSSSGKLARRILHEFKKEYDSLFGVLCFSSDWLSPLLWSHYADKHRGVCLGFNLERASVRPKRVRYVKKRLSNEQFVKLGSRSELQDILLHTKFAPWSYEREWRILVKLDGLQKEGSDYFFPLNKSVELAEVILGLKCELSLQDVRALTMNRHPKAVTYQARPGVKFFSVVPNTDSVP